MIQAETLFFALIGGILPTLAWLWFWLREDSEHPEPRWVLTVAFLGGMFAALLVYPFEILTANLLGNSNMDISGTLPSIFLLVLFWAGLEEIFKYVLAYTTSLSRKYADEPIDLIIYMLVTALGFAALENSLFLIGPLTQGNIIETIATGNTRFIGSTLLHTLTAITISVPMAMTFYKKPITKKIATTVGIIVATALHTAFNLFIIKGTNMTTITVFSVVWLLLMISILFFEKIKKIYSPAH